MISYRHLLRNDLLTLLKDLPLAFRARIWFMRDGSHHILALHFENSWTAFILADGCRQTVYKTPGIFTRSTGRAQYYDEVDGRNVQYLVWNVGKENSGLNRKGGFSGPTLKNLLSQFWCVELTLKVRTHLFK
jgi:hypothetical protein